MDAQSPPPLANATRLAALRRSGLLDSPREESYDRLTRLAAEALHTRIALMTLVDVDQHYFKSSVGLPEPWASRRRGPLDCSLCHHVVASGAPFVVEDARTNPLVRESRAVVELSMVSYAGVPLRTQEGEVIGAFAGADGTPRPWPPADVTILEELGAAAMHEVALRGALRTARDVVPAAATEGQHSPGSASSIVLAASPVALCVVQDGLIQFASPSLAAMFGYVEEEPLSGMSVLDLAPEPERRALAGAFERLLATERGSAAHEFRGVRKDGTTIELELLGARAQFAGRPAIVAGVLDITGRRTTDTRLRHDVDQLRAITQYAWDVVHMVDPDDRILYISPSVERVLGYRPEEMTGRHSRDFVHPDDLPAADQAFKQDIGRPGANRRLDLRLRHKDGSWREVEVVGQVIAGGEGGAVAIVNTHDVTERRRSDRELRRKTASIELLEFVAAASNAATSIDDAIRPCLERICTYNGWQAAHVCLRDAAGNMVSTGTWYLSDAERLAPFRQKTDSSVFAPGIGLPGKVLETGTTTWTPDVTLDESFTRLAEARASGLKGGLACPLLVGTQVVGALEFFADRVLAVDEPLTGLLSHVGSQLGRVVEREQARDALLKSENRIRSIMEMAHDAFVATDQKGVITEWNQRAELIFGWARDEAIGRSVTDTIIPLSQRAAHRRVIRQLIRARRDAMRSRRLEIQVLHRAGHEFPAELSISAIPTDGGFLVASFLHDITARKQAEERLRCSEERYDLVARATSDIVWDWNVVSGVLTWNKALQRTCRYQPDQIGSTMEWWYNHIHPADRERVVTGTHAVLNGTNELWSDEYRLRRGDGTYATLLARGHVVRNDRGEAVRMIGSMLDITERKLEEESQRFIAQASALLDTSLDQQVILDSLARLTVPTLADLCLIDLLDERGAIHRAAETHLEATRDAAVRDVLPMRAEAAVNHVLVSRVVRARQPLLVRDCSDSTLELLRFADEECDALKRLAVHSLMVVPLIAREQVLGALTLGLDDASRRYDLLDLLTAEQLAQRAARTIDNGRLYDHAQHAIRARDEVLALVSHDLRNPLTTISLSASYLLEESARSQAQPHRFLGVIKRSAEQANALIRNLLDVSSIEAGQFSVHRESRNVGALMEQACELLTPLAEDGAIRLACVPPPEAIEIPVDASQLDRVFSNLVGNALKFTPKDGVVTFSARKVEGEVQFSVTDTGPGMPADQVPHVFDRFWQGRSGDRRGAGLGLSIARGIVEAHGGRIWLESREGVGTTVSFTIPLQPVAAAGADRAVSDEPVAARESAHPGSG